LQAEPEINPVYDAHVADGLKFVKAASATMSRKVVKNMFSDML